MEEDKMGVSGMIAYQIYEELIWNRERTANGYFAVLFST
jgi:hypothetical protein